MNMLTNYGETTLLGAMAHGDFKLVKLLLKKGVHINIVNAHGQNDHTYNLAQNPSAHLDTKALLAVAGEFCFTVTCNGQNFIQKYTPSVVSLIPIQQDKPYTKQVRPLTDCCKMAIRHHLANVNSRTNLFISVLKLPLPKLLQEQLLSNV